MAFFGENGIHAWAQAYLNGTPDYRDAYNISSIDDRGVGRMRFNFSFAAINNDFAFVALSGNATGTTTAARTINNDETVTTTSFSVRNLNTNMVNTVTDDSLINVIVVSNN